MGEVKMILSVHDRLLVLNIFEKYKSDILNAEVVRDGKKLVSFSDEEIKGLQLHIDENGIPRWLKNEYDVEKEFSLSPRFTVIIEDELKKLNNEKRILVDHVDFYYKFIEKEK